MCASAKDLQGEWLVTALGMATPMNLLGDHKHISGTSGFNLVGDIKWGYFNVEEDGEELVLNYDTGGNSSILCRVIDRVSRDGDGWAGTLFLDGRAMFDFRLDREP